MLELRALGNAEIETDKTILTPSQEIVFAGALYLILERGKRISRTGLAELLWPSVNVSTRSHRMRQTLLQLKKLGVPLTANRDVVRFDPKDVRADIAILDSLAEGSLPCCESLEFLPGYSPRFSEPFRDWVDGRRGELHSKCSRAMLGVLNQERVKGAWAEVERIARQCLHLDPFNESAVLAMAEASVMRGQKQRALSILDDYLREVGSTNADLRVPATMLRRRIVDSPTAASPSAMLEPAFLGREKQIEQLISELRRAQQGLGNALLVTGEAGIGKTRLAKEFGKFARLQGITVLRAGCRRPDVDRPLSTFVDLVPELRELPGALGCSEETLCALTRLTEFDGRSPQSGLSFEELSNLYSRMRHALFDLFDALTEEQCLLIIVEDVQWLDVTSARLLDELGEWSKTRKLLFVFNSRLGADSLSLSRPSFSLLTIELPPLQRVHAVTLLHSVMGDERTAERDVVEWLLSVGEGNPFFLQELGKHWLETGHRHEIPPSVATVLNDRLSRLSRNSLQVLQACGVLGEHATVDRVEDILEYKAHEILAAVHELSLAGMIVSADPGSAVIARQIRVRHDLIAMEATGRLAPIALSYLHTRAGGVLEQAMRGARNNTSLLWAAAFHWVNAGDTHKALAVAQSCAEHLLEVGFPADASAAFEKAYEYCQTDESRLAVLSRLVVALQLDCQWERSKQVLIQCRHLRSKLAPEANLHDELELRLFDARWRASLENSTLLSDLDSCLLSPDASPEHRVSCGLLGLKVASDLGITEHMHLLYERILPLLQTADIDRAIAFEVKMVFHSVCGDPATALKDLAGFLDDVRSQNNALVLSRALCNAAFACRLAGRQDEAISLFSESLDHSIKHGLANRAGTAASGLVRLFLARGDVVRARAALEKAESLYRTGADVHTMADQIFLVGRLAFEERNLDRAQAVYALLEENLTPEQSINRRSSVLALGIVIGVETGWALARLRKLVTDLHSLHLRNRGTCFQDFEAHALYVGFCRVGESELGLRLLKEYVRDFRRDGGPLPDALSQAIQLMNDGITLDSPSHKPCVLA